MTDYSQTSRGTPIVEKPIPNNLHNASHCFVVRNIFDVEVLTAFCKFQGLPVFYDVTISLSETEPLMISIVRPFFLNICHALYTYSQNPVQLIYFKTI